MFFVSFFPAMFSTRVSPLRTTRTTQSIRASDSEERMFTHPQQRFNDIFLDLALIRLA